MRLFILLFLTIISLNAQKINIIASISPQKYFIERISGDKANITVMVKPGFSPATYEPKNSQMIDINKAKLYFSIGVAFEDVWIEKFKYSNKNLKIVNISKGIKKEEIREHHHEELGDHKEQHDSLDPHIWLDPILVKKQAKNIFDSLVLIDSANKEYYQKNYKEFLFDLDILHNKLKVILKDVSGKSFMVFHPSWGYFAKRYNLEQIAVEKNGKEPKPKELISLVKEAKKHNVSVIFVSPQFSSKSATTIAKQLNINVVFLDPLSIKWKEDLIKTANEIRLSYKKQN